MKIKAFIRDRKLNRNLNLAEEGIMAPLEHFATFEDLLYSKSTGAEIWLIQDDGEQKEILADIYYTKPQSYIVMFNLSDKSQGEALVEEENIQAYISGVHYLLPKWIEATELKARLNALIRLFKKDYSVGEKKFLNWNMGKRVLFSENKVVKLSKKENEIIKLLFSAESKVMYKNEIAKELWKRGEVSNSLLNVYMYRLRQKFKIAGINDIIETIAGKGYSLKKELLNITN